MSELAEVYVRLFKSERNQTVCIPHKFQLTGDEVIVHKEGKRVIIEPVKKKSLLALLSTWSSTDEEFPDVDQRLPQLGDVKV